MITAASLKTRTSRDLAQMAKKKGIQGWHAMRKDQLVRALLRLARRKAQLKASPNGSAAAKGNGRSSRASSRAAKTSQTIKNGRASRTQKSASVVQQNSPRIRRKIQQNINQRQRLKDLASSCPNGTGSGRKTRRKDRAVLMVRDSYWLHVHWELCRQSIERVRVAMAEHWHTAQPTLRLLQLDNKGTTNTSEKVIRDIAIHGGVNNWYVDVQDPPNTYRIAIGYLSSNDRFHTLVRSNSITTPVPGSADIIDENWSDVAQNYERIYAMSGGYASEGSSGDLQELFEERLRRPMGSPIVTRYGVGAEGMMHRESGFEFEVDAEMIIYGTTKPGSYVTLGGEPVQLRPDGSFTVRMNMPDKRQVIPVVASSGDGVEQRTVVLAIERNTKVMEPKIRDPNE